MVGVTVGILSPGAAPAPSASHSLAGPPSGAGATGPPVILQVVIPASPHQTIGSLIEYRGDSLSPGRSATRIARWSDDQAANPEACASTVAAAPNAEPIKVHQNLWLCVELKGKPSRYGLIDVTAVTKAEVTATATLWP